MKICYEGVYFLVGKEDNYRLPLKIRKRKLLTSLRGKYYAVEDYLTFAYDYLNKKKECCIIDVGCNIGLTILPLAKKFPSANIIAVEPHPKIAYRFLKNKELNQIKNIHFVSSAVSNEIGPLTLYESPNNIGGHRITGFEGREDVKEASLERFILNPVTMENMIGYFKMPKIDLLKIDVEGYECQVLLSLKDYLNPHFIPRIICEYGPEGMRASGYTGWEMVSLLKQQGYRCFDLHTNRAIDTERDIPDLPDFSVTDFVFTPKER